MTRSELKAALSLLALGAVYWWFQMRLLDGLAVVDQPASKLLWVYLVVIAAATIAEILIASSVRLASGGKSVEKDERDLAIEAMAGRNERYFIIAAVNVLIWQALWEGAMERHLLPHVDLTSLPTLFFALFTVLFAGEAVRLASILALYRLPFTRG